jgi:hypothetical protein
VADQGGIEFTFAELMSVIEDLMRVADDLPGAGDEVNAFLVRSDRQPLAHPSFRYRILKR